MALLVQELSRYCRTLPAGSLVVASSERLLDLCPDSPGAADAATVFFPPDAISVVGVPEVPTAAKE